jgi:hypothetical protein
MPGSNKFAAIGGKTAAEPPVCDVKDMIKQDRESI